MTLLVTGAAGFIGRAVCERLLLSGQEVIGVDCFNAYYDPALKEARAATLSPHKGFRMVRMDIADTDAMATLVKDSGTDCVIHLAAQAGVRHSIDNPFAYA
ncbi:MAG: SDR family NAD(P)-dependent oxidoreductase, partial [Caulobacteraceae bacterium]|nr:SDR family NAD(P)-dependent oxidoreductase [Caulobacteraceae bacterium]